jgi:hypothetical protein
MVNTSPVPKPGNSIKIKKTGVFFEVLHQKWCQKIWLKNNLLFSGALLVGSG